MFILVACEESQAIANAYRERGHFAFSCDILPCSGGHPEYHILHDCLPLLYSRSDISFMFFRRNKPIGSIHLLVVLMFDVLAVLKHSLLLLPQLRINGFSINPWCGSLWCVPHFFFFFSYLNRTTTTCGLVH